MTNRPWGPRRTAMTRTAFIAAPLCMLAYGAIRLSDPDHGPGPAWTSGHVALITGVLLFGVVLPGLLRLSEPTAGAARLSARTATLLGLVGVAAVTVQGVIDVVVGFRADDRAGMNRLYEEVQSHPGVMPAVYTVGPMLFYVGLLWLVVQLAVQGRIAAWRPVLVTLGIATTAAGLDLIPLSALLFCAALSPLGRDVSAAPATRIRRAQ
ncbi:hypothetical protein [Streptomyces fuscichromogenes]|uniref:DUF4386 family protein n=1 Tax=Streptomyces fuscichromogenes TaxID=1324013 RepID=A0A917UJZ6_9ACTN|nr:hypothetical protein [Streptomyces fuscichromogenes]GGM92524.1 hypothetical protein GCM10011578_010650 [Streptomyces fuscichromogenes]